MTLSFLWMPYGARNNKLICIGLTKYIIYLLRYLFPNKQKDETSQNTE